ncbi:MAG: hypothetical protein HY318_08120 [Armatimonadetes bacterium]|nr:hypothetical protein [Armatimonadota bacterium]
MPEGKVCGSNVPHQYEMAEILIPLVDRGPEIDGDLSQDVWQQAPWQGGFTVVGDPEKTETEALPQTSFSMVHDGRNLYIAVEAEEPHLSQVRAIAADDPQVGSAIFGQDLFEFFIDAEALDQSCAQIAFNSRGALVDLWLRGVSAAFGATEVFHDWDSKARISTGAGAGFWWAQLCLPLDRLKFSPKSDTWKFNIVRTRVVEGTDGKTEQSISSFAPHPGGNYYNPQSLQRVRVENLDFSRFLWNAEPTGSFAISGKGKGLMLRQPLRISNLSPQGRCVEIRCTLEVNDTPEGRAWTIRRDFAPNEKREEMLEMPVSSEYFGNINIALTDTSLSEQVFSQVYYLEREELSWKEHRVLQGDGKGEYVCHPAKFQFLPLFRGIVVFPFGLAEMDNGEIVFAGCAQDSLSNSQQAVVAFTRDRGATWSDYEPVEGCNDRPMMLTYLGNGNLTFLTDKRYFSHDYGRTWPERVPVQPAPNGLGFWCEGNAMVDRTPSGTVARIAEIGFNYREGFWPEEPCDAFIRWSEDGGRTWMDESKPEAWLWQAEHNGKTYTRSVCEGALVRAANGWLVAALRTDLHPRYLDIPSGNDNLCGTAVSISKDEGKTWSPLQVLFAAGRMHGNLVRLPNNSLVLTVIRRIDVRGGRFASYRRGCDAFISHDHGLTWNLDRMYILDDFAYINGKSWASPPACGHLYSIAPDDGSVLTTYGNYRSGAALIHWRP